MRKKTNYSEIARRVLAADVPNVSDVRKLVHAAIKGHQFARRALVAKNNELANTINANMTAMEKEGYDYGNAYRLYEHFTESEYKERGFRTASELKKDWGDIGTQLSVMGKIMDYKDATLEQQKFIEVKRIRTLKRKGILPMNYSNKNARKFLRFLGREETQEVINEYGESGGALTRIWKAYKHRKNTAESISKAFTEYLAQRGTVGAYDFFDMMEKLGVTE